MLPLHDKILLSQATPKIYSNQIIKWFFISVKNIKKKKMQVKWQFLKVLI